MKRGQAATEFLVTYGWAIMVVLVVIGALSYFGIINTTMIFPSTCTFSPETSCFDTPTINAQSDQILLSLRNNVGAPINITNYIRIEPGCVSTNLTSVNGQDPSQGHVTIPVNGIISLTIFCQGLEEGKSKADVYFRYVNVNTYQEHIGSGHITGLAT